MDNPLYRSDLLAGFQQFNIQAGDKFVVHSSLSSLGYVEGGADTVIEALIESVSPGGTVFVPTMTFGQPFHVRKTPSKVGKITDVFWRRPDAHRSHHPTHSIAGIGPDAARILDGHEDTTTTAPDSPLGKLAYDGGAVMLLGVSHTRNTTVHVLAEIAELPYLNKWGEVEVLADDGTSCPVQFLRAGCSEGFDNLEPFLEKENAQQIRTIGNATVRYLKAIDIIEIGLKALRENPALLLCDQPDCAWCHDARTVLNA